MNVSDTIKGANLVDDRHRINLTRRRPGLDRGLGLVAFVLNNPSIADATFDDPTVRRGWGFTEAHGYSEMMFVNTNPARATDPRRAWDPPDAIMLDNDAQLQALVLLRVPIICAWGDKANPKYVARALAIFDRTLLFRLGSLTEKGNPRHPLYLPAKLRMEVWVR